VLTAARVPRPSKPFLARLRIAAHKVIDAHRAASRNRVRARRRRPDSTEVADGPEQRALRVELSARWVAARAAPDKQRRSSCSVVVASRPRDREAVGSTPGAVRSPSTGLARLRKTAGGNNLHRDHTPTPASPRTVHAAYGRPPANGHTATATARRAAPAGERRRAPPALHPGPPRGDDADDTPTWSPSRRRRADQRARAAPRCRTPSGRRRRPVAVEGPPGPGRRDVADTVAPTHDDRLVAMLAACAPRSTPTIRAVDLDRAVATVVAGCGRRARSASRRGGVGGAGIGRRSRGPRAASGGPITCPARRRGRDRRGRLRVGLGSQDAVRRPAVAVSRRWSTPSGRVGQARARSRPGWRRCAPRCSNGELGDGAARSPAIRAQIPVVRRRRDCRCCTRREFLAAKLPTPAREPADLSTPPSSNPAAVHRRPVRPGRSRARRPSSPAVPANPAAARPWRGPGRPVRGRPGSPVDPSTAKPVRRSRGRRPGVDRARRTRPRSRSSPRPAPGRRGPGGSDRRAGSRRPTPPAGEPGARGRPDVGTTTTGTTTTGTTTTDTTAASGSAGADVRGARDVGARTVEPAPVEPHRRDGPLPWEGRRRRAHRPRRVAPRARAAGSTRRATIGSERP
jgi:hypothetical protein